MMNTSSSSDVMHFIIMKNINHNILNVSRACSSIFGYINREDVDLNNSSVIETISNSYFHIYKSLRNGKKIGEVPLSRIFLLPKEFDEKRSFFYIEENKYIVFVLDSIDKNLYEKVKKSKYCCLLKTSHENGERYVVETTSHGKSSSVEGKTVSSETLEGLLKDLVKEDVNISEIESDLIEDRTRFNEIFEPEKLDSLDSLIQELSHDIFYKKIPNKKLPVELIVEVLEENPVEVSDEEMCEYMDFLVENPGFMEKLLLRHEQNRILYSLEDKLVAGFLAGRKRKLMEDILISGKDESKGTRRQKI